MIRRIIALLITLSLLTLVTGCQTAEKRRFEGEFLQLFDTATRIIGYAYSEDEFSRYVELIHDELEEYHQLYDIYNDYEGVSNIKTINDNAGLQPVEVDRKIIDLILFSKDVYKMSEGKTNIALGSVLSIWHDYRDAGIADPQNAELPPMESLLTAAEHTDIEDVVVNEAESTVFLTDPQMSLDVGGIAKGYAVEQVSKFAMEQGFTDGLISVGGNVRSFGYKGEDQQLWSIGIRSPKTEAEDLYTVQMTDRSLVSSGDYIRYYTVAGKRYHHIIDPQTLFPSAYYQSVSIVCPDSGMADALSTTIFNLPFEEGLQMIENLPDTEAVWVFPDDSVKFSSGFEALLK